MLSVYGPIRRAGGEYDRVSGGPGYSTVVEFMRADINRQRNHRYYTEGIGNGSL